MNQFTIGNLNFPSSKHHLSMPVQGNLRDLRIYSKKALKIEEIQQIY